jgi:hypothetical protein
MSEWTARVYSIGEDAKIVEHEARHTRDGGLYAKHVNPYGWTEEPAEPIGDAYVGGYHPHTNYYLTQEAAVSAAIAMCRKRLAKAQRRVDKYQRAIETLEKRPG